MRARSLSALHTYIRLSIVVICGLFVFTGAIPVLSQTVSDHDQESLNRNTPLYDIVPLGSCGTSSTEVALSGKDNIEKAYNYFIGKGLTPAQSAGIVGNLRQESGVNPKSNQKNGPGRGIAQWSEGGRWDALVRWANNKGILPDELGTQLDYIWHEMNDVNPWKETLPALKKTTTVEDATRAFEENYEKAGTPNMPNRIKYAKETLEAFGGGSPDNSTTGACGGSGIVIDGYSFPLAPQTKRSYSNLPCENRPTVNYTDKNGKSASILKCHHDGSPAFDLMYDGVGGKPVYALTEGKIVSVSRSYVMLPGAQGKPCGEIQFQANNATDKTFYWYGHILPGDNISSGKTVKAGDQLGTVATRDYGPKCWGGGQHLHIDRGCINGTKPEQGGSDNCRDPQFLQDLKKIWDGLSE